MAVLSNYAIRIPVEKRKAFENFVQKSDATQIRAYLDQNLDPLLCSLLDYQSMPPDMQEYTRIMSAIYRTVIQSIQNHKTQL